MLAGWPLWWALGVTQFVFPLFAAPLAWQLYRQQRVRVPPGFWLWALFLLWVLVSALALDVTVEGTLPPSGNGRYLAFTVRFLNYVALTVMMLYVANASERELPRRRLIGWFTALGVQTIALGVLAVAFPGARFRTAFARVLPSELLGADAGVVALAQVQSVLGETSPRPAAPFAFTNAWGNNLSLLLIWIVLGMVVAGPRRKLVLWPLLAVAVVPVVYSLNRGMWIGIGLAIAVVSVRLARRGRRGTLITLSVVLTVGSVVFALSPLASIVQARLDAGHSNDVRSSLARDAISSAITSPVIGYGTTRETIGSDASIAIGASPDCPKCGNRDIGSTGQLWLILIAQGVIGAALYVGFFLRTLWTHRRDHSPLGIAGTLVIALELFYGLFYTALTMALAIALLTVGLLQRNRESRSASVTP